MSTITTFTDGQPVVQLDSNMMGVVENYISFAATSVSAADVVEVLDIPAGMWVDGYRQKLITAEGAACTVDIGDAVDPNGYDDTVNLNATAGTVTRSLEATDALGIGKYYASADTVDFTMGHDTDTAIVYVAVIGWWPARYAS